MALREINENGETYDVAQLPHQSDFESVWQTIPAPERQAIDNEIERRLDELVKSPNPNWGSITNTSIEGGKENPFSGVQGDWGGTPFQAIYEACGRSEGRAGMFYGNVWKRVIITRPELWIGIRSDPTFPKRGITLGGKTYFLSQ